MRLKLIVTTALVVMLVAACGSPAAQNQEPTADVAAIRTSAASTVVSQFTLTAAAFTPTTAAPALPTETVAPEATTAGTTTTATVAPVAQVTNALGTTVALCDSLQFVADVNIPDDTKMSPGQDFVKT
jgi:hypothetical protein